jgi:hypothetical protein
MSDASDEAYLARAKANMPQVVKDVVESADRLRTNFDQAMSELNEASSKVARHLSKSVKEGREGE